MIVPLVGMADWVSIALALLGGVGGALILEGYKQWTSRRRRPELTIVPDPLVLEHGLMKIKVKKRECAYLRLLVNAAPGKDPATGVHVRIDRVRVLDGEAPPGIQAITGMWLAWADVALVNPRAEKQVTTIPGGSSARLDLVHLNQRMARDAILDVRPQPGDHRNYLRAVEIALDISLTADNAAPRTYTISLRRDGREWSGWDESAEGHIVAYLDSVPLIPQTP
jgi:hypothetical protein